jgi:hypothetical protein
MQALLMLLILNGWPEKIAVADAVVTVAQAQQPALPNDLKRPTPAVPREPMGAVETINPGVRFIDADADPLIVTLYTTERCTPCEKAKKDLAGLSLGRPVVVFIRKGEGQGPFPEVVFQSGFRQARKYSGWYGTDDFLGRLKQVESGK